MDKASTDVKDKEVLRLRGAGPPTERGECCMEDCTVVIKARCPTCEHHVCLVDTSKVDGLYVCIHCKEIEKMDGRETEESENEIEVSRPDGCSARGSRVEVCDSQECDVDSDDSQECEARQDDVQEDVEEEDVEEEDVEEEDVEEEDVPDDVGKCLKCKAKIKSPIPHMKTNKFCKLFYVEKYRGTREWIAATKFETDDLKVLGRIFKAEKQREKRKDKSYRKEMNQNRKEKRTEQKIDEKKCAKDFFQSVEDIFSKKCQGCKAFLSPTHVEVLSEKSELYDELFLKEDMDIDGDNYICKWCIEILKSVERRKEFGGEDESTKMEYKNWSKENFSYDREILKMKRMISENSSMGVRIFNDQHHRKIVLYPLVNQSDVDIEIDEKHDGMENCEPTVLLPQKLLEEDPIETLSRAEFELANRLFNDDNPINLLSVVILDRLGMMKHRKQMKQKRNSEVKKGVVKNSTLKLRDMESVEGCLKDIKGSVDFHNKQKEDFFYRQFQNGVKNITIKWVVFKGYAQVLSDPFLAMAVLRSKGHVIKSIEKVCGDLFPIKEYRVCCDDRECNPFKCTLQRHHQTPLEMINDMKPEVDLMLITKFMTEKIQSFVDKIVKPIAKEHALFISFDRPVGEGGDSGFILAGHIWIEDLAVYNSSGQPVPEGEDFIPNILKPSNLSKLLGDGGGRVEVSQTFEKWNPNCYSEQVDVTEPVLAHLQFDDIEKCREISVFEALLSCGRNQQMTWYSQKVLYINTEDPRKVRLILILK
jgi:hypothetical protein